MRVATALDGACIDFHGVPIDLRYSPFRSDAFSALFAGFARRPVEQGALRVELSSTEEPCTETLSEEWRPTFFHGLVQVYSNDGLHVLSDGESRLEVFPSAGRLSGKLFEGSTSQLSSGMQHIALSLLLRERGVFDAHAATACTNSRAYVLLGDSGAGKTTLLLALMGLGCDFLGDDRLLFRMRASNIELLAYPREFHVGPKTMKLLSNMPLDNVSPRSDGKYPLQPLDFWPERFRKSWLGPISILLPHVDERAKTSVRKATAAEAFGELLSSSATVVVETFEGRSEHLRALREFADASEAYYVVLGGDLLLDPTGTMRGLLNMIENLARRP